MAQKKEWKKRCKKCGYVFWMSKKGSCECPSCHSTAYDDTTL